MIGVICSYNKPHDQSIRKLLEHVPQGFAIANVSLASDRFTYTDIQKLLDPFDYMEFVVIGDVFWPTGQHICKWCEQKKIQCIFLQHGQWIYIANKQMLSHYPSDTLLFGQRIHDMVSSWPYAERSKLHVTGSPRYDDIQTRDNGYVFFSPPVIEECSPSGRKLNQCTWKLLSQLSSIDHKCHLVIQPHYREGRTDLLKKMFPMAQFVDHRDNALKWVADSSCIMTSRNSTSVLDGIACGKKNLLVDLLSFDQSFYGREYFGDFAVENDTTQDLFDNVSQSYSTADMTQAYISLAKNYIYLSNASERVWSVVNRRN